MAIMNRLVKAAGYKSCTHKFNLQGGQFYGKVLLVCTGNTCRRQWRLPY